MTIDREALEDYLTFQGVNEVNTIFKKNFRNSMQFHELMDKTFQRYTSHSFNQQGVFETQVHVGGGKVFAFDYPHFINYQHINSFKKLHKELEKYKLIRERKVRSAMRMQELQEERDRKEHRSIERWER